MNLSQFIRSLVESGEVTVPATMAKFGQPQLAEAAAVLKEVYHREILETPGIAPDFHPQAAVWAARYLYHAVQLAMLRDQSDEVVEEHLFAFSGGISPETIYSVDLTFRYLPDLLKLARGLAPGDILVQKLKSAACAWPFSSVGLDLEGTIDHGPVIAHPALRSAYIDRIIEKRDRRRITNPRIREAIRTALGAHADQLWPDFKAIAITTEDS